MENLLRFLEKDHSFFTPWSAPPVTAEDKNKKLQQEEEEEVAPGPDQTREEEDHPSTPFSLFSRQFDNCEKSRDDEEEEEERKEHEEKDDREEDEEEEILLQPGVLVMRIHSNWIASGLLA